MIDESAIELSVEFARYWNNLLKDFPRYQLDTSWPSIGTLDLIFAPLRGRKSISEGESLMLRGASAYLAGIAHDCWESWPESTSVQVSFGDGVHATDILIRATRGPLIEEGKSATINVTETLRATLRDVPNPLPVFSDGLRYLTPDANLISSIASGICSGLSPYVDGPWSTKRPEEFSSNLANTIDLLSRTAAENYIKVYPSEAIGSSPKVYHPGLILPPISFDEKIYGARAISGLADFLLANVPEAEDRISLCQNLARSPDELIATAGLGSLIALNDLPLDPISLAVASSRRVSMPKLRRAICLARSVLGRPESWVENIANGSYAEANIGLYRELMLHMIPAWYLEDSTLLREPSLLRLFELLANSHLEESVAFIKRFLVTNFQHPELYLQHAFLLILSGKLEEAEQEIRSLDDENLHPVIEFKKLELRAIIKEALGEFTKSLEFRTHALTLEGVSSVRTPVVMFSRANLLERMGKESEAISAYEKLRSIDELNFDVTTALVFLNKGNSGSNAAKTSVVRELLSRAPRNAQLFHQLLSSLQDPV